MVYVTYFDGQIPQIEAICTPKLQRLVYCSYVHLHVVFRKKKEYAS